MLSSIRSRAPVAMCARAAVRTYYSSGSSSSAYGYGYTAYAPVEPASAWAADPASSSTSAYGCPADNVVAPLECMNRNARKPSPANHGARPNSSYNRKRSSPEFGSWRHAGLRPGQTPPPRPQPGTPSCVAAVATGEKLEPSPAPISINKPTAPKAQ